MDFSSVSTAFTSLKLAKELLDSMLGITSALGGPGITSSRCPRADEPCDIHMAFSGDSSCWGQRVRRMDLGHAESRAPNALMALAARDKDLGSRIVGLRGLGAEDVGAQVVAGDTSGGLDCQHMLRRHFPPFTPVADNVLSHAN